MRSFASKAFSLIELLVVLAIMTIVIAILLNVRTPNPQSSKKSLLAGLNNILNVARQEASSSRKNHRILFVEKRNMPPMVVVQVQGYDKDNPKKIVYMDVEPRLLSTFILPPKISIHAIYINGRENWNENKNRGVEFLLISNGAMQDLTLQFSILEGNEEARISYILQPFMGRFVEVDGWVKSLTK